MINIWELWAAFSFSVSLSVIAAIQLYSGVLHPAIDNYIAHLLTGCFAVNNALLFCVIFISSQTESLYNKYKGLFNLIFSSICFSPKISIIFMISINFFVQNKQLNWYLYCLFFLLCVPTTLLFTPLVIYLVTLSLFGSWKWYYGLSIWFASLLFFIPLFVITYQKERKANNPLQGILEPTNSGVTLTRKLSKRLFVLFNFR